MSDETSKGASSALKTSGSTHDQRVSLALAAGRTGVWSWDPTGEALDIDSRVAAIWGVAEGQSPPLRAFMDTIHSEDRAAVSRSFEALLAGRTAENDDDIEFRITRLDDGRERWIAVRGQPFFDQQRALVELVGTVRDITDHKLHDIHLHMLLREITHRSKNLLAIIQAMARQTVKDSLTAEDFEQRLSLRLRGLAASHELLAAQDWHGAHIEELVKGQLGHVLETYTTRISYKGPVALFEAGSCAEHWAGAE